jgi:hypothetical protein
MTTGLTRGGRARDIVGGFRQAPQGGPVAPPPTQEAPLRQLRRGDSGVDVPCAVHPR